ncbi:hypothetical protein [Streptomyces sp. SID3343]|uniref:hypothetical protein n=1 Tax=Streptomyces sp. SID3343 TaxID=2690260 RepID=UPI0013680592|nr:hypothetical protein [Streptomyces sp. SID3343]MYW04006.1 hypothetical protein [Streptomyces sp. SID3343]
MDDDLCDPDRPTITTTIDGVPTELPYPLVDICAALLEHERDEFDDEIGNAPIRDIASIAVHWAVRPAEHARIQADADRIRSGDHTGVVDIHGTRWSREQLLRAVLQVMYSNRARSEYSALPANVRRNFDGAANGTARGPYAHGSAIRGDKARRFACLAGVMAWQA